MDRLRNKVLKGSVRDRRSEVSLGNKAGFAGLAQAAGERATPQIRNQATLGGNLVQASRCQPGRR